MLRGARDVVVSLVVVSLDVVSVPEVVDDGAFGSVMSVVTGGLVLVMVSVAVVEPGVEKRDVVLLGSRKYCPAGSGSSEPVISDEMRK